MKTNKKRKREREEEAANGASNETSGNNSGWWKQLEVNSRSIKKAHERKHKQVHTLRCIGVMQEGINKHTHTNTVLQAKKTGVFKFKKVIIIEKL